MARTVRVMTMGAHPRMRYVAGLGSRVILGSIFLACSIEISSAESASVSVVLKERQRRAGMTMYDSQEGMVPNYVTDEIIVVTARDDSVIVKDVIVNRGNCKIGKYGLPATLKFGEQLEVTADCDPLEAIVETDKASYDFKFEPPNE